MGAYTARRELIYVDDIERAFAGIEPYSRSYEIEGWEREEPDGSKAAPEGCELHRFRAPDGQSIIIRRNPNGPPQENIDAAGSLLYRALLREKKDKPPEKVGGSNFG